MLSSSTENTQKIVPHLWFDKEAKEAAALYTSLLPDSSITLSTTLTDTPSGDCDIVSFRIAGYSFMAISAGSYFKINPCISFFLNFDPSRLEKAREHLEVIWGKLAQDGKVIMPLEEYPFSKCYGWIQDKYGVSWQLMLTNPEGEPRPLIIPSLMFTGNVCGKAEEASDFYLSVFKNTKRGIIARYPQDMYPDKEGDIMFTDFMLEGQWFTAMDSAGIHNFTFSEAVSLIVNCGTQEEIDYYWDKLSSVPDSEMCGWCKDKYGVSWQIIPSIINEMMRSGDKEKIEWVTDAFLNMKKIDIAKLIQVYDSK